MELTFLAELLIALAPALALFAVLVHGRYPGERAIARLTARTKAPKRGPAAIAPARRAPRALLRTGELIARSLATRPPPAPARF